MPQRRTQWTDSCFAWVIVGLSFAACMAYAINMVSLGILFPELLEHFQVPQAMLGILGSCKFVLSDIIAGQFDSLAEANALSRMVPVIPVIPKSTLQNGELFRKSAG